MASLIPSGSATGSGSVTLTVPTTNSNQTATLPDATGTVMVSGNMPAFSAYSNALTTINNNTATKIAFQVEEFDTANCFDSTANYRFTPNVAGYYQVNASITFSANSSGFRFISLYKNGSNVKSGVAVPGGSVNFLGIIISTLVYLNGSTDYIEIYGTQNSGSNLTTAFSSVEQYFQAYMVRTA